MITKNRQYRVVLVTAPDLRVARRLARAALEARLVACANLLPGLESHYWWQGKLETGREVLLILKTVEKHLPALEALVQTQHPDETPEFVVLPIASGSQRYLQWLKDSV